MIRRLAGWAMVTSACCGVAALISWSAFRPHLLPGGWLMLAAGVLCILGLAAPDETEEQRQYRHAQRHPDRLDQMVADHEDRQRGRFADAVLNVPRCADCHVYVTFIYDDRDIVHNRTEWVPCAAHADPASVALDPSGTETLW